MDHDRQFRCCFAALPGAVLTIVGIVLSTVPLALFGAGVMFLGCRIAMRANDITWKKISFSVCVLLIVFSCFELAMSTVAFFCFPGWQEGNQSVWIFEDSGRTVHFDRIQGYKLTRVPSRMARITKGTIEYVGRVAGNRQGFPDEDDFTLKKPAGKSRYLVFGDSFSSAQFIDRNWPDFVEHDLNADHQLLNCSIDGGGLANWWHVLANKIDKEGYQYDGMIFAVFHGDLMRGFTIADHRGYENHMFARLASWNPQDFPQTLDEAQPHLRPLKATILSADEFDRVLSRQGRPENRPIYEHFWVTGQAFRGLKKIFGRQPRPDVFVPHKNFHSGRNAMVKDIRQRAKARGIRPLVVHIPTREELLMVESGDLAKKEARAFARLIGGKFMDGALAFAGLTPEEIKEHWLPYDGHWAQLGSNRFAHFMRDQLVAFERQAADEKENGQTTD